MFYSFTFTRARAHTSNTQGHEQKIKTFSWDPSSNTLMSGSDDNSASNRWDERRGEWGWGLADCEGWWFLPILFWRWCRTVCRLRVIHQTR